MNFSDFLAIRSAPKRQAVLQVSPKRGKTVRPRSVPQLVDALTALGFSVSTRRTVSLTTLVSIIAPYSASFDVFSGNAYFDGRPIPISNLDAIVQALGKTKGAFSHASNWDLFSYRLDKNGKIASESYVGVIPLSKNPTREEIVSRLVDYAGIPNIVIQSKTDSVVEAEQENYTAEGGYTVPLFRLERKGSGSAARYDESRDAPGLYPISSLRPGAYFKRKADAKKVYRKGEYDRSERTYAGLDTDDISRSIALKGDTRVYVGFDY